MEHGKPVFPVEPDLSIDSPEVDSMSASIVEGSEKSFTLHWIGEAGAHSYEVKLYNVDDGQEYQEDYASGSIEVSYVLYGMSAWLNVAPNPVKAGNNVTVIITVKNSKDYAQTWPVELVDNTGNVWWPNSDSSDHGLNYTLSSDGYLTVNADSTARITATIGPLLQNTTLTLKLGGHWMASSYVKVQQPATTQAASMGCSNLELSAKKGNLVLDTTCTVYFTNPTDVQWNITGIIPYPHILKTEYTEDLTPEFTPPTMLTKTVPAGGVGEFKLNLHDVLPENNVIGTGIELNELSGVIVPVKVNFTVLVNGKTYVVDSQGKIWSLEYGATRYVRITVNTETLYEHITSDITIGIAGAIVGAKAGEEIGAMVGTVIEPGAGTVAGAATGEIIGGIVGFIGSVIVHEKLGWP
ncbi:hypothetical protein [Thermococcus sp. Bubb.Bath]|uniref:hypothetical protein n=1 Tax=Thermococcus sp. Bubb.Bath TaxID=1638242 RepID=UPI00143B0129|nr:hypothetical protein [Thermococcus sp. Bubb.Bath]NJF25575.1 hypothetical protein [Thermococcus sp. Bubb.Bath]